MKIIHVDMDAFFASVESRDNPSLRGKPLIVGGDPRGRGVVCSASYEARKFGIRSAMSCARARRLCPEGIFVSPDFTKYTAASRQIGEIFRSVTPLVEPLSLDEAYLDVTENLLREPLAGKIAAWIRRKIFEETGLTASAGVGPNKFIAKIASDFRKPDGLVIIPPEKVMDFIARLPVGKLWGVGPATEKKLNQLGIWNTEDLRTHTREEMLELMGSQGGFLHDLSHGIDDRQVEPNQESKSCGSERTFEKDILDVDRLKEYLSDLAEEIALELKKMRRPGRTVTLKFRYSDFSTITRSRTLPRFTDSPQKICATATKLLLESTDAGLKPARLIGISVSGLWNENEPEQLWLDFPPPWD